LLNSILTDRLPTGTTFESASSGGVFDGTSINWNLGTISPGSAGTATLTVRANDAVVDGDIITNVAGLTSSNASPIAAAASLPVLGAADLQLIKTADLNIVLAGGQIVYTINYKNRGNALATGLSIEDGIPQLTTFVSASNGGTLSNGVVKWNLADLAVGATGSVQLTVQVDANAINSAIIDNTGTIDSDTTTPLSSSTDVTVYNPRSPIPVLKVKLTPNHREINSGGDIVYSVDYANITPPEANDLQIVALLPDNVIFIAASPGGVYGTNDTPPRVIWNLGNLPGNTQGQVRYQVRHRVSKTARNAPVSTTGEVIKAIVSVTASNTLPITNDFARATVLVKQPDVPPPSVEPKPIPVNNRTAVGILILLIGLLGNYWQRREIIK